MPPLEDFITCAELATETGINKHTLLARIRAREVPTKSIGVMILIPRSEVHKISEPVTRPAGPGRKS